MKISVTIVKKIRLELPQSFLSIKHNLSLRTNIAHYGPISQDVFVLLMEMKPDNKTSYNNKYSATLYCTLANPLHYCKTLFYVRKFLFTQHTEP